MPVLDPRTVERVAELICDVGGAYERSVRKLVRFLEAVGWAVEYDGSPRVPWLVETINEHNDDQNAVDALLRRVIDPREYDDGMTAARLFAGLLTPLLAADGIIVGHVGSRPVVSHAPDPDGLPSLDQVAAQLASPELRSTVRGLVRDPAMADILSSRLDEVEACRQAGAYLLAVIGTGAFMEGLLFDVLRIRDPETKNQKEPSLQFLLQRAHIRGWIEPDALRFGDLAREYRNLVHPREQLRLKMYPDDDTLLLCWQPALAIINDLSKLLPGFATR